MSRLLGVFCVAIGISVVSAACTTRESSAPTAPSFAQPPPAVLASVGSTASNRALSSTHGELLEAVLGSGSGIVNVTPTAAVDGSFSAQINVSIHDAPPNTTLYVQRAPEIGRPNGGDGICQRAAGLPPWGAPAPNFVTFPLPGAGPLITLQTSPGGAGTVHIDFAAPTIQDGIRFDVMFRLVDSLTAPTVDLRTGCFTVTVR